MTCKTSTILAAGLAAVIACTVSAQPSNKKGPEAPLPPQTNKLENPGSILIPYTLAFLMIGGIVGITAIPAKRGHQD